MKMFCCSAERSCKVLLQESFCNFSFKDFFLQMPISLFSFLFSLFGNEKCGGTKHQSFFLSLPTTTTNQPSPSGIVNDCREKASNSQVSQQEKHFWVIVNIL